MITVKITNKAKLELITTVKDVPNRERAENVARYLINYVYPYIAGDLKIEFIEEVGLEIFKDMDKKVSE